MKKIFTVTILLLIAFLITIISNSKFINRKENVSTEETQEYREIKGSIKKGETLFDIFKRYGISITELFSLKEASADVHKLRYLYPGRPYRIVLNSNNQIDSFVYWLNDDTILNIIRTESGFYANKVAVEYEKKIKHIRGIIKDNLISSMGDSRESIMIAHQLSDIFAWDIDFTTDLRNGDVFKIVVEELYLDGKFRKYGDILSTEFRNNGEVYYAYRFEYNEKADYFNAEGKSVRKAFLKAPLNFRRISSGFTSRRLHPILKIYRPHHGLDYAAPRGTPVSVVGDGTVVFAGYKGRYGKLVLVRHPNGYRTYYGHLSRIAKNIKKGAKVEQGRTIGYVGATGLATGPHLHYEMRLNNKPINPFKVKIPSGKSIPRTSMAEFKKFKNKMNIRLASIKPPVFASTKEKKDNKI